MHFTNHVLDDRAIWASWYQILEAFDRVRDNPNKSPIESFAIKLQKFHPRTRHDLPHLGLFTEFDFNVSGLKIGIGTLKKK